MSTSDRPPLRRRIEIRRTIFGSLLEIGIKAYGAAAAMSVAVSDAETVGGKGRDAVLAVSTLKEKYDQGKYIVEHRDEIAGAIEQIHEQAPESAEIQNSLDNAAVTLDRLDTTYDDWNNAVDSFSIWSPRESLGHVRDAWEARPKLSSIAELVSTTQQVRPILDSAETLTQEYYVSLLAAADNFARDERMSTILVMAASFLLAFIIAKTVGFTIRRGRPGIIAFTLQKLGARVFRRWYVDNAPFALSAPLYSVARERVHQDIVKDPAGELTPEALRDLERYFARRRAGTAG